MFSNKAPLLPVNAKQPIERHQVDLVDMRKLIVEKDAVSYKSIVNNGCVQKIFLVATIV